MVDVVRHFQTGLFVVAVRPVQHWDWLACVGCYGPVGLLLLQLLLLLLLLLLLRLSIERVVNCWWLLNPYVGARIPVSAAV